jgi:hypothetical protein
MKTINIFLASSQELKDDRKEFQIRISQLNKTWIKKQIYLQLNVWEDFLDAMSQTRLQDEYNKTIRDCDIFVMLFFTKVGMYTGEEFEVAFGNFRQHGKPAIYTYFRNAPVNYGDIIEADFLSVQAFKKKLNTLGHFYTVYASIDQLKLSLTDQLEKLLNGNSASGDFPIDNDLARLLDEERENCRTANVAIYTPSLIRAVIHRRGGVAQCLNSVKQGYADLLKIKINEVIKNIKPENAAPFLHQDWQERTEIIAAAKIASEENSKEINDRHIMIALIEKNGNTIRMMQEDVGADSWHLFTQRLRSGNLPLTPGINPI